MTRIAIDFSDDPEIPAGRRLLDDLVGAHMAADDEDELLHLVSHSIDDLFAATPEHALRVMTHAAYRGQALIIRLLSLAASQKMSLDEECLSLRPIADAEQFRRERLDLWSRLRDDQD